MGKSEYSAVASIGAMLFVVTVTTMTFWQSFSTWGLLTSALLLLTVYSVAMQLVVGLFVPSVPATLRLCTRTLLIATTILIIFWTGLALIGFILSLFGAGPHRNGLIDLSVGTLLMASIAYVTAARGVMQEWRGRSMALPVVGFVLVGMPPWTETIFALELMAITGAVLFVIGHVGGSQAIDSESASLA